MTRTRVAVAMSGGVDSSVAAAILKEQGYDVIGFSMQLYDQRRNETAEEVRRFGRCCALDDLYDARRVASQLGIAHYIVNFESEFDRLVVHSFIEDYRNGLTPSPCVLCNSRMKFDHLVKIAGDIEADCVATGHYARVDRDEETGRHMLRKGLDEEKDQSYFLFELRQEQLARAMFPLGDMEKHEVRRIARRYGLEVAEKAESQEICFVPDGDYAGFIDRRLMEDGLRTELPAGEIVDSEGRVVGAHGGVHHFTIGQRRGLGVAHSAPLYVIELKPRENRVVVAERNQLEKKSFRAVRANWIGIVEPSHPVRALVKIRSRHSGALATLTPIGDAVVEVECDLPQMAITPGQAAVFYSEDLVLGGGWIDREQVSAG